MYVASLGTEANDDNHRRFFCFKGDRNKKCDPQVIYFTTDMLTKGEIKSRTQEEMQIHFAGNAPSNITPIDDTEGEQEITFLLMLPIK